MTWIVQFLDDRPEQELEALSPTMRAKFEHIVHLIQKIGLERVREPYVKHVRGPLWELRMRGEEGIARALYVTASGRRIVVLRVFVKKTQKIPQREISIALSRSDEVR